MPHPTWPSNRHYIPTPDCFRKKLPCGYFGNLPRDMPRDMWIILTRESFQLLIRHALSQPSNGTVRRVDPPDEETRFVVVYGFVPDKELIRLLVRLTRFYCVFLDYLLTWFPYRRKSTTSTATSRFSTMGETQRASTGSNVSA